MNFELNEQQLSVQKIVREFAEKELMATVLQDDETSTFPAKAYEKMGQLGLIGLPYPAEYGGQDGDYLSYVLAVEEVSKVNSSMGIAYSVCTSLFSGGVINSASEELKKKYLPDVLSGKKMAAFCLTEPEAGSDAARCRTTALWDGENYILNGLKCFITNGPLADYFLVFALTEPELKTKGMSAFIVEKSWPGVSVGTIENKCGIRSAQVSEIIFENVKVPKENMVGEEGKGFAVAMKDLDGGRIGVAAQGLGIAKGAYEIAFDYLKKREQFGKPLYKNQYLAFKMVDLALEIEQAQYMLYKAAVDKQEGKDYSVSAAKAKLLCTNAAMNVSQEAVQMLGGNGYMKEYHVERMMRDAKITQIYEGTNEIQKLVISGRMFR
jgi:butyryl-CoA dehydrogenase